MPQERRAGPGATSGVYLISGSRMIDELFSASTISEPFRNIKEGVDADVPVDAQNASTATWKTADSFPQAPTPIIFLGGETRTEERPATKPTCYPCPRTVLLLMSPAAQSQSVAARDLHDLPRHPTGLFTGKQDDDVGDIRRRAEPTERNRRQQ